MCCDVLCRHPHKHTHTDMSYSTHTYTLTCTHSHTHQPQNRKHDKIRKHISELKKSTSSVLLNEEDGLPTCEPFKIKMIESIT